MNETRNRRSVPDRARKRAVRALAAELGVAYSVAARLLAAQAAEAAESGPAGLPADEHRAWLFAAREQRTFHSRVRDTRTAAELPLGRAAHLARRFPPLRDLAGAGPLYHGEGRETLIAMLYAVLEHESPHLLPSPDELTWAAELGEETAVDIACRDLDRAARQLLDQGWQLWPRVDAALAAGEGLTEPRVRDAARVLGRELRSTSLRGAVGGARNILDALLAEAYDAALPPGAPVLVGERLGTVVGVCWEPAGPPGGYRVRFGADPAVHSVAVAEVRPATATEPEPVSG
ncbi:hypothetical protein BJY16_005297 [Actinoplanes octamycinicus]|uniref:Uncharacterized protein n=1 Tax=Actinoplanes octamycinicus TaxID=135948 RepID=A0A7W7H0U0_9ACTN|nr:hypothetical protein [Actinoplanes octamycinicus]MBB4741838.1 hypothetical protein [Actinoplanes octamycinicus]GIE60602.1 hypothetical protein Aoc01nite_60040 [Actinoplanes octamycinicus]